MSIQSLILIAGMHRSGTSVVTRLCNLLGADIGGDLMPATPDNPKGYWENQASFDVHAALFQTYGMAWNSLPSLPEDWLETEAAANAGGALGAILTGEFSGDLAVVKDPKVCRVLPLWRQVAAEQSIEPMVVLALRHPMAVAGSLVKRDGMGLNTALSLWLRYTVESERDSRGLKRALTDYDRMLADWQTEMAEIASQLDLVWPIKPKAIRDQVAEFISADLRHNTAQDIPNDLAACCVELYEALLAAKGGSVDDAILQRAASFLDPLDTVPAILNEQAIAHIDALIRATHASQLEVALRTEIGKRDRELLEQEDGKREQVAEYDKMVRARESERDELREHIHGLSGTISDQSDILKERAQEIAELRHQLNLVLSSRSWKITAPLRDFNAWRHEKLPYYRYLGVRLASALSKGDFRAIYRAVRHRLAGIPAPASSADFGDWVKHFDKLADSDLARLAEIRDGLDSKPTISILMPVYKTPIDVLTQAIQSVRDQIYDNWQLCIVDDGGNDQAVVDLLRQVADADPRIKVQINVHNQNIAGATNDAFALASGDFIALMDHDDLLRPHALLMMALALGEFPDADILYSDEDKVDEENRRYSPYFKPAWNRDLFYGQNYLNHLTVIRKSLIEAAGQWRTGFDGSQDYDLLLRAIEQTSDDRIIHVPLILYHWRAIAGSAATEIGTKSDAASAGERALAEHFERRGIEVTVGPGAEEFGLDGYYRVQYALPKKPPLVSLIVPTKDQLKLTRGCIEGILERTDYDNLEILLVDNNSEEPETLAYFASIGHDPRVRVLRYEQPFNFSAINNFAAAQAKGSVVGLINNDTEVIDSGWLTEMVSQALRPDVGCVGAKLYYSNDQVQHGGVIIGLGGIAGHSHKYYPRVSPGYFGRLVLAQELSAVTAACLLIRKSVYDEVGGLDEGLKVAFNDVDFCLRVREAGYRNIFTPYAALYHLESISRGFEDTPEKLKRFQSEMKYLTDRWGEQLLVDPTYSPNLTLDTENFALAMPPRSYRAWAWDQWPGAMSQVARLNFHPQQHDANRMTVGNGTGSGDGAQQKSQPKTLAG
ncbi:MAG: hypothetical protein CL558_08340 [Alphaproteobacteria bacterium]|nr:hypothetical protein [Alphaproteobacteria bacterium]MAS46878.1 hypothetical protein [Alphaproteobacteria bacterium]MAX94973.1 hypothetical protein [Alphaproteobacteria bacterium]MBN53574.1 hypothetical protein [Alphaproteobacteria bacterium]OUT41561.1 MAG: hypothetical protein CBB62_04300 [Micavibrio sp. TMED2]|tara:strand:+ start:241 stop:3420 length:3180 start_codon:yes stop_codon:yes gene_type:complete